MPLENFFENFCRNFAKTAPSIRDRSERGRKPTSRCMRGGEQLLELTPSQKKTVRHQFDSFCRKVLREEARDHERHIAWRSNHEVSLSELSEEQERQMYVLDEYPFVWGDRIFEKCGIGRDEGGDGGKTLEIRGKRRLSARDGGANYQQS